MNRIKPLTLALAIALGASTAGAEVDWSEQSYDEIIRQAKTENKHVYIDFYTTWCGPCKRMDKVTYVDGKVESFLGDMIAVKYDAEKGDGIGLAEKYRVHYYPTSILLTPDGKEIDRVIGYRDPPEFIETLTDYMNGIGTIDAYKAQLAADPDNLELLCTLGLKLADAVRPDEAARCLDRALELDPNNESDRHAEIHYGMGESYYNSERYEKARREYSSVIASFSESEYAEDSLKRLAYVEHELGNNDAAVANYEKLIADDLDDPRALNGFAWFCSQRGIGLDKALTAALKAVELSDHDAGIVDTLAEVYAARGEYDNAIAAAEEALASDPEDQYFNDQVKKFKDAKAKADEQARR